MRKPLGKVKNPSLAKKLRRKLSIRAKINGTAERPRLCATKTNKHLRVQVIDDVTATTLLSVQTYGKGGVSGARANREGAKLLGAKLAEELKGKKIESAVFDRSGSAYTGVLATLVDSVRENGIRI
ncbi:MAG: 50S ribosomal protein L18 [Halobacteriovorax sp.]|nr:50S ribosomal protein L18 [Halobacteriovorax sp.]|tara:strand:- start:204451 stop:204828 length:378 start_codon:yes stop_codon:yes gene_type:complete